MLFEHYLSPNIIDIFTDASMMGKISGYGFLVMNMNKEINSGTFIDTNSTSNRGEIKAIKMAIHEAIRLRRTGYTGTINIFSDSQISVFGIRDRIFNWDRFKESLYTKEGKLVANQSEYIEILQLIVQYNPCVIFYHQKGHVNINDKASLFKAKYTFMESNILNHVYIKPENVSTGFIKYLSTCNGEIDNRTRWYLRKQADLSKQYKDPFKIIPTDNYQFELNKYYNIMNNQGGFYQ